jgi:hypothetical protein
MSGNDENWLSGICNYTGPGYDLPLGGYSKVPNWQPIQIVKRWKVLDAELDEGWTWKKSAEVKPEDVLIGCEQNTNSIEAIVEMYGRDFYQIRDANGVMMTLDQWQAKYHSNGLGLVALRQERDKQAGTYRPTASENLQIQATPVKEDVKPAAPKTQYKKLSKY